MTNNKFKIIIPSYNNSNWIEYNISSVLNQTYSNYEVLYIDDASSDDTFNKVVSIVGNDSRWKVIKRLENKGATYNYFFGEVQQYLDNNEDIVLHLDGDDWLIDENVLSNLNNFYVNKDVWMTYGKFYCYSGSEDVIEGNPQNTEYPEFVMDNKLFRRDVWRASHLRTYKTFLYKKLDLKDLFSKIDNKLFWHASDLAFQYPFMEMCPKDKLGIVDFPTYVYNQSPKNSERTAEREHKDNSKFEIEIRNKKKYKEGLLGDTIPQINVVGDFRERNSIPSKFSYVYNLSAGEFEATLVQDMEIIKYINGEIEIKSGKVIADIHEAPHLLEQHKVYEIIKLNYKKFDAILTFDADLLKLPNSIFRNGGGEVVLNKNVHKQMYPILADDTLFNIYSKKRMVSFITSNKIFTEGHKFRIKCINHLANKNCKTDLYGVGFKEIVGKIEGLKDYAFSIAMENGVYENYFTEKILDCFLTGTIPIYHGCPNISNFFDMNGILTFNTEDELVDIINNLTLDFYSSKIESIKKNFDLALNYRYNNDIYFEKYIKQIINAK